MDGQDWSGRDGRDRSDFDGAAAEPAGPGRVRRSTLERFNDELSVLDRPLEAEVEYYDDPPRRPWRRAAAALGVLALVGAGAFTTVLALGRRSASAAAGDGEAAKVAVVLQPAPSPMPAAAAPPATPTPAVDSRPPPSRQDWETLRPVATPRKHAPHATAHESRKHHHTHHAHG